MDITTRLARTYSLAGLARWLRLCNEEIAASVRPRPEVLHARDVVARELVSRGVEL